MVGSLIVVFSLPLRCAKMRGMQDNRDDYEPIIATRPNRQPSGEDTRPLWPLVLALSAGFAVVVLLGLWFIGRSNDSAPTAVETEEPLPEIHVEQPSEPPAIDSQPSAEVAQAPTPSAPAPASTAEPATSTEQEPIPDRAPEAVAENAAPAPSPPATESATQTPSPAPSVSLLLASPDSQVRFEVRGPLDSSPARTSKAGDIVDLVPGTYRVVASGAQLETIERELTLSGGGAAEFIVELCVQPEQEIENLAGRVVELRSCTSTPECESMFTILSEEAEQLVKDREFRAAQCAKWRDSAAPEGKWTLETKCDGEAAATMCRIEIAEGACSVTGPRRSVRGEACPRAELH